MQDVKHDQDDASNESDAETEADYCAEIFGPGSAAKSEFGVPDGVGEAEGEDETDGQHLDSFDDGHELLPALCEHLRMRGGEYPDEYQDDADAADDPEGFDDLLQQPGEFERLMSGLDEPLWTFGVRMLRLMHGRYHLAFRPKNWQPLCALNCVRTPSTQIQRSTFTQPVIMHVKQHSMPAIAEIRLALTEVCFVEPADMNQRQLSR